MNERESFSNSVYEEQTQLAERVCHLLLLR